MKKTVVWKPIRPHLTIEVTGGTQLGRCYHETRYRVISRNKLSQEVLVGLSDLGLMPRGQEFGIRSQCDGKEEPGLFEEVPASVVNDKGERLNEPAMGYFGKPMLPVTVGYYIYDCYERTDSGD